MTKYTTFIEMAISGGDTACLFRGLSLILYFLMLGKLYGLLLVHSIVLWLPTRVTVMVLLVPILLVLLVYNLKCFYVMYAKYYVLLPMRDYELMMVLTILVVMMVYNPNFVYDFHFAGAALLRLVPARRHCQDAPNALHWLLREPLFLSPSSEGQTSCGLSLSVQRQPHRQYFQNLIFGFIHL